MNSAENIGQPHSAIMGHDVGIEEFVAASPIEHEVPNETSDPTDDDSGHQRPTLDLLLEN
ncbi:unannotated protein [freshwater metagenome]|uniref:Unannotated protein n=1 Tax=freshwater metagenome TaxID=449393 RepID=A0A6J6T8K8_9ZZZZ